MAQFSPVTPLRSLSRALHVARSRLSNVRSTLFAVLLLVAVLVNVVQFPGIEQQPYPEMRALARTDTSDLTAVMYRDCPWCRQRFGIHLSLGVVAPGARVIIPSPSPILTALEGEETPARLRLFGRASEVDFVPFDASGLPGIDPMPYVISSGDGGTRGAPWLLAVDPRYLPAGGVQDPDNYLLDRITGEGPRSSVEARTFVLVRWNQPRPGHPRPIDFMPFVYTYQDLLIEASLLPADIRQELIK